MSSFEEYGAFKRNGYISNSINFGMVIFAFLLIGSTLKGSKYFPIGVPYLP